MAYRFIQARRHGGKQAHVRRIVIHATVSPCKKGGARSVANCFHTTNTAASAHYVVDPGEIVQCLSERTIGYHAPPNTDTIGIELCDPMKGSNSRWHDKNHEAMLKLAAKLVKEIAKRYDIPLKKIGISDLRAGRHGICGHRDVSNTWHMTDHTDPGSGFPWKHFMDLVGGAVGSGGGSPRPTSPTADGVLRQGESGSAVRNLQRDLNSLGAKPKLTVDGDFGPKTRAAVSTFQRAHKLTVDGIAGPQTLGAVKKALAHRSAPGPSTTKKATKPVRPPVATTEKAVQQAERPTPPEKSAQSAMAAPPEAPEQSEQSPPPEEPERTEKPSVPEKAAKPDIDGIFGTLTTKALQAILNRYGAKLSIDGVFGTLTKKELQKYLDVVQDGSIGPVTVKALQERLRTTVDGIWGEQTTRALQAALNAGTLGRTGWRGLLAGRLRSAISLITRR